MHRKKKGKLKSGKGGKGEKQKAGNRHRPEERQKAPKRKKGDPETNAAYGELENVAGLTLTPEMLEAANEYLRASPPFVGGDCRKPIKSYFVSWAPESVLDTFAGAIVARAGRTVIASWQFPRVWSGQPIR
jgi:hypothetical protein